jgi:hypothetical protein
LHGNDRGKRPSCWSEERIRERGGRPGSYLLAGGGAVARIVAPDRVVASAATELLAERRKKTKQILQIPPWTLEKLDKVLRSVLIWKFYRIAPMENENSGLFNKIKFRRVL